MPVKRIYKKIDKEIWLCKRKIEGLTFDKEGNAQKTLSKRDYEKSRLVRYILKKLPTHYRMLSKKISEQQ